jgi:hypothetical protein
VIEDGQPIDLCDSKDCGDLSMSDVYSPDVYLVRAGQTFKNLTDKNGVPIPIQSKRHKKQVMDELGVQEAGNTINGARYGSKSWIEGSREYRKKQFENDRPKIQKIYREWRERNHGR